MIAYIAVGILFLLVVGFAIISRKEWHWVNIVFLVLTFLAGTTAISMAAKVYTLRSAALRQLVESEAQVERILPLRDAAIYGPEGSFTYTPESLRGTNELLNLEVIGQGRAWLNGTVEKAGDNYLFKFQTSRDNTDPTFGKLKNVLLYVFGDAPAAELSYPVEFLGTFRVKQEALESLELAPQFVVAQESVDRVRTWSLFEKMPIDRWQVFQRVNNVLPGSDVAEVTRLRNLITSDIMPAARFGLDPASREYEQIVDQIVFDGMALGDIETWIQQNAEGRKSTRFEPSPEEVFVRYRFEEKSKRSYVVDATGTLDVDGEFSSTGQAFNQQLHIGQPVTFEKGDEIFVDQITVDGYQRIDETQVPPFSQSETVTELGRYYRRKLVDYPLVLAEYRTEAAGFAKRTAETKIDNEVTQKALDDTLAQQKNRDDVIARLQQDRDNLRADANQISELLQKRKLELDEMRQRIESLKQDLDRLKQSAGAISSIPASIGKVASDAAPESSIALGK